MLRPGPRVRPQPRRNLTSCSALRSMTRQPVLLYIATTSAGGYPAPDVRQEQQVRQLVLRFIADQAGATAIEYALIATGISIVILASVNSIGTSVSGMISPIGSALK